MTTIRSGVDPDDENLVGDTCADDEDFLSEWKDYWYSVNPNHVEQSNKKKYVPLRARNGALRAVRCLQDTAENFKKKWFNALGTLLKITEKSGSFRKFNRSVDIPMPNGLRFHLHDFAICRFGSRGKAREMLQAGITHIQELNPSCAISASILFVVDVPPDNEWMKASKLSGLPSCFADVGIVIYQSIWLVLYLRSPRRLERLHAKSWSHRRRSKYDPYTPLPRQRV